MKTLQERLADLHEAVRNCPEVYYIAIDRNKPIEYVMLDEDGITLKGYAEVTEQEEGSFKKYKVSKRIGEGGYATYYTDTLPEVTEKPSIEEAYEKFCKALNEFVGAIDGH